MTYTETKKVYSIPDDLDSQKKKILECLENSLGVVSTACREAGLARSTFYEWCKDEEFKSLVDEIQELAIDTVESALFKRIKEGDTTAMIFYLKTKGKKRGYVERQEIAARVSSTSKPSWFDVETKTA